MKPKKNGFEKAQGIFETVKGDTFSFCCIDLQCAGNSKSLCPDLRVLKRKQNKDSLAASVFAGRAGERRRAKIISE